MAIGFLEVAADIAGWGYFLAWTVSFAPQIYENWRRKSVTGFSLDMWAYFMISYVAYLVYNAAVFFDEDITLEVLEGSHDQSSPVKPADVVFAIVAFSCTAFQGLQCAIYDRGRQRIEPSTLFVCFAAMLAGAVLSVVAAFGTVSWLFVLNYCGYVKLCVSFGTYVPQIFLNYKRKSTEGFHIGGVLLDFTGGLLSVLQMDLYCVIDRSLLQFTGNIPKLALGIATLLFDIVLIWQHYVLYIGHAAPPQTDDRSGDEETSPLLPGPNTTIQYSVEDAERHKSLEHSV